METTKLSSKGQVIIPKRIRDAHHWDAGLELVLIETADGILLKPRGPFAESSLDEVAGSLKFAGPAKSLEQIDAALKTAVREAWRGRG